MNRSEFNQWWNDYSRKFPDTGRWMAEIDGSVLGDWERAMGDVSLADALEVNLELLSGDLEPLKAYEREQTPGIIRRHVKAINRERYSDESADRDQEKYRPSEREAPIGSARGFVQQIETLVATGMTGREAAAQVFPNSTSGTRYSCLLCKDTGWADVWSNEAIRAAIACVLFPGGSRARMCVLCSCDKGERDKPQPRFSHDRYCEFGDGDPDELREWITSRKVAELERRRHKEFDEFNRAGAR